MSIEFDPCFALVMTHDSTNWNVTKVDKNEKPFNDNSETSLQVDIVKGNVVQEGAQKNKILPSQIEGALEGKDDDSSTKINNLQEMNCSVKKSAHSDPVIKEETRISTPEYFHHDSHTRRFES